MGFGNIISAMVSVLAIIMASYVFLTGALYMTDTLTDSVKDMQNEKAEFLRTDIDITNITVNGTSIYLTLNNSGHTKIKDFSSMDVIVHSYMPSDDLAINWVPYSEGVPAGNQWTVTGLSPDQINPGIFDPDEEMNMQINLSSPIKTGGEENWIQVTTPNGVSASKYFNS